MSNRVVVVGGFAAPRKELEPVGEAICRLGLADDADIFTLLDARQRPNALRQAVNRAWLLTHSAGITAVKGTRPERLTACNGPELRTTAGFAGGVIAHGWETLWHGDRTYKRLAGKVVTEFCHRPHRYIGILPELHNFSTVALLHEAHDAGIASTYVYMKGDRVCPYTVTERPIAFAVQEHPGRHDEILYRPQEVLRAIHAYGLAA